MKGQFVQIPLLIFFPSVFKAWATRMDGLNAFSVWERVHHENVNEGLLAFERVGSEEAS